MATRVATAGREVMREVSVAIDRGHIGLLQTRTDETRRSALATAAVPVSNTILEMHVVVSKPVSTFGRHAWLSLGQCQFAIDRLINPTNVSNL
ncbi:hypothetical protein FJW04_17255 [Mesorhizobium sp. B2-7-3]|uniref:hypothetical protein n=1 Tax=Mesorhizobium sp. B2-7-3 TaxID=2589907 RepID=UPI00112B0EEA|nr:hypothetical protein [Mesorhizobium sp. B2-7-3]TPJ14249.1 hypothetical protein FJW04_17255 [Mesorhizobium sp. B2-7-3]